MGRLNRRAFVAFAAASGMALASAAPVLAAPPGPVPNTPSCHGQFIATSNLDGIPGVDHPTGLGVVAQFASAYYGTTITVQDLQAFASGSCG